MAQNNGRNGKDIPVSKRKNQPPQDRRQSNPYKYEDLVRKENGEMPRKTPTKQNQGDVYFSGNRQSQSRPRYDDYLSSFENEPRDIQISKKKSQAPAQEYSKGGGRKTAVKPKKKRGKGFKAFLAIVLIVGILFVGATGYVCSIFASADYVKAENSDSSSVSSLDLKHKFGITNILLIGVDDRKGGTVSRSDTMILVTIDKIHRQLKMTSFMRDTYVTIPGHGEDKLNAACVYGGPQLVVETLEYNFGIDIDNFVLVDFSAFKDVIDSLGGVTVEVEKREAEYINRTSRQNIEYGDAVELNGEEALVYVRIRYLDSDFYRTQRQRKVISAILNQVKKSNPLDLIETGKTVLGYVETDLSPLELTLLAEGAVLSYMRYDIVQSRIPFDNKYISQTINGASVLTIDKTETSKLIQEFIFNKAEKEEDAK